jgi:hypothetical protein
MKDTGATSKAKSTVNIPYINRPFSGLTGKVDALGRFNMDTSNSISKKAAARGEIHTL